MAKNDNYAPDNNNAARISPHRVAERMCCVCRKKLPKEAMIRIVQFSNRVFVDQTGKSAGRGCHICPSCIEKAIKTKAINRSFKHHIDAAVYEELKNVILQ